MSEDATKKKRKREASTEARITYHTPAKSFERLFNESSLEETKRVVRRKLGLADSVSIDLAQKRGDATIVLEDEDDFKAFTVALKTTSLVELQVTIPNQDLQNPAPKKKKKKFKSLDQSNGGHESVLSDQAESQLGSSISAIFPPPSESFSSAYRGASTSIASPEPSPAPIAPKPAEDALPDKEPKKEPKAKEKRKLTKATTISTSLMSPTAKAKAEQILQGYAQSVANKPPRVRKKKESKADESKKEDKGKEDSATITSVQALPPTMDVSLQSSKVDNSSLLSLDPANAPVPSVPLPPLKSKSNTKPTPVITKPSVAQILDTEKGKNSPKTASIKEGQRDDDSKTVNPNASATSATKKASPAQTLCAICDKPFHLRFQCPLLKSGGAALDKRLEQLRLDGQNELVKDIEGYLKNEQKREQLSVANRINPSSSNKSTSKKPQDKQGKLGKDDSSAKPSGSGPKTVAGSSSHVPVQKPGEGSENSSDVSNNADQLIDDDEDMEVWDEVGSVGSVPSGFLRPASPSGSAPSPTRISTNIHHSDSETNTKLSSNTSEGTDASNPSVDRNQRSVGNKGKAKGTIPAFTKDSSASEGSEDEEESQSESNSPSHGKTSRRTDDHSSDEGQPTDNLMITPHQKKVNYVRHMNTAPAVRTFGGDLHHAAATGSSPLMPKAQLSQSSSWFNLPTLASFRRGVSFKPSTPTSQLQVQRSDAAEEDERAISDGDSSSTSGSTSDDGESDAKGGKESKRLRSAQRASSGRTKTRDRLSQL